MATDEQEAPGWYAIDKALEPLYGTGEPPFHYTPKLPAVIGGRDPIDGISVYHSTAFGREHWHFVTYGFSELYAKETAIPTISGYGFELTFRLVKASREERPPGWAFSFLQNIARYVFSTGNTFEAGHYMNLNSAIAVGSSSLLRAILFTRDPALPSTIDTPNGALTMLQVVGVTLDEVLAVKQWDSQKFLILIEQHITGALTDLERDSLFSNPAFATRVQMAISTDGSSTGTLFPAAASFRGDSSGATRRVIVTLGANGVRELLQVFPGRLPFDRPLTIVCRDRAICFTPSRTAGWESTPGEPTLQIHSTHQFASELLAVLKAEAGEYHFESMPNLSMVVERSAISDRDGNIVEWIG